MQVKKLEQNSLYTTQHVSAEVNETDLIVHIGDLSYADGFAAQVMVCFHCFDSVIYLSVTSISASCLL